MNDLDRVPSGDRRGRVEVGHVGSLAVDVHGHVVESSLHFV
jgi:hypothetical protein